MGEKIKISFSKREKFDIFSHILLVICKEEHFWTDDQIGIQFQDDGFSINEITMNANITLSAFFPKKCMDNSLLKDIYIPFDVDRFRRALDYCRVIEKKYEMIDITFDDESIIFLSNTEEKIKIRTNQDGHRPTLGKVNLPIKLNDINKENFETGLKLEDFIKSEADPSVAMKLKVTNNRAYLEATTRGETRHGLKNIECKVPKNAEGEILLSIVGLDFIRKLAEEAEKLNFQFMPKGFFQASIFFPFGIKIDVGVASRTE